MLRGMLLTVGNGLLKESKPKLLIPMVLHTSTGEPQGTSTLHQSKLPSVNSNVATICNVNL